MKNKEAKYDFPSLNVQFLIKHDNFREKEALVKKIREIGKNNSEYATNKYLFPSIKNANSNPQKKFHSEENHRNNVALLEKLVQISTRPFSKEYALDNYAPLKKMRGFRQINTTLNINIENTRIMGKILEQNSEFSKNKMKSEFKKHKELTKRLEKFYKNGDSIKLKSKLKEKTQCSEDQTLNSVNTNLYDMKFNLDSNQKNNNACFINKKYYELGERKNYSGKTNKIHKGHPHSADKRVICVKNNKCEEKTGKNDLEVLLELYEERYTKEIEQFEQNEKKENFFQSQKEKKNKSFHEFGGGATQKEKTTDIINEILEERVEEFSFQDIKDDEKPNKKLYLDKKTSLISINKNLKTIETIGRKNESSLSEINGGKDLESLKPRARKHSLSYDDFLPKLTKKGNSCSNYFENYNYIVIAEDILETVEVLKKRKMSF